MRTEYGILTAHHSMETFQAAGRKAWRHVGFGCLRDPVIARLLENYEPLYDPQVVPVETETGYASAGGSKQQEDIACAPPCCRAIIDSVDGYRQLYLSGILTPTEVANVLLPLISRNEFGPPEHSIAFLESNTDKVLEAAAASTQRYKEKRSLGPMDGVPTAVEDEYHVHGYRTTLGSRNTHTGARLEDGTNTSWCVRKLEEAGALVIGKTTMDEYGLDTTGNNPIHGTPRNPFNPQYYTGGSSSGTGYAVSIGLIPVGLGSDVGGSIRIPASLCGVFGLKPTHGRVSFEPGQNRSPTCACLGPIASDIKSLATVFQIISQPHPSSPFPPLKPLGLSLPIGSPNILGIPRGWIERRSTPRVRTLVNGMIDRLVGYGYTTVDINIPFVKQGQLAHAMTVLAAAAALLPETRNLTYPSRVLLALGRVTPERDHVLAQKLRRLLMQHLASLWEKYPGMLIITPTTACEGLEIREERKEMKRGILDGNRTLQSMEYAWLANFCGLPSISCPVGFVPPNRGLAEMQVPVGIMATGGWCCEEELLQFGAAVEGLGTTLRKRPPSWVNVVKMVSDNKATE